MNGGKRILSGIQRIIIYLVISAVCAVILISTIVLSISGERAASTIEIRYSGSGTENEIAKSFMQWRVAPFKIRQVGLNVDPLPINTDSTGIQAIIYFGAWSLESSKAASIAARALRKSAPNISVILFAETDEFRFIKYCGSGHCGYQCVVAARYDNGKLRWTHATCPDVDAITRCVLSGSE